MQRAVVGPHVIDGFSWWGRRVGVVVSRLRRPRLSGSLLVQFISFCPLQLAADKAITPLVQVRPMAEANQALVDMEEGKARYRYVLVN